MMTFANNLDPDEAPQDVGPHLKSKLFNNWIIRQQKFGWKHSFLMDVLNDKKIEKHAKGFKTH